MSDKNALFDVIFHIVSPSSWRYDIKPATKILRAPILGPFTESFYQGIIMIQHVGPQHEL